MTTVTHEPTQEAPARKHFSDSLASEMWASLAISVIWLSVLFEAIYAPPIETRSAGGDYSSVPTAVVGHPLRVPCDVDPGQACISARRSGWLGTSCDDWRPLRWAPVRRSPASAAARSGTGSWSDDDDRARRVVSALRADRSEHQPAEAPVSA